MRSMFLAISRPLGSLLAFIALATAADAQTLPDWSGVWERYEGNGGMFDVATTTPADGRAGSPGVRQHPPLTDAWEEKYQQILEIVADGRLPDPISFCGTPAGYPRLLALPDVYEFIVRPEAEQSLCNFPFTNRTGGASRPVP